jgi:DNA-binding MarR family transcriptional regulator
MTSPKHDRPPRPADLAIVGARMLTGLLRRIWNLNYKSLAPGNMGISLVLMMVAFRAIISTGDNEPLTVTELANILTMPPSTVRARVATLIKHHRVKLVAGRKRGRGEEKVIIANLDQLDRMMTVEHVDASIEIIEDALNEIKRLRALLYPQLIENGKRKQA